MSKWILGKSFEKAREWPAEGISWGTSKGIHAENLQEILGKFSKDFLMSFLEESQKECLNDGDAVYLREFTKGSMEDFMEEFRRGFIEGFTRKS